MQIDPFVAVAILGLVNFVKSFGVEGKAATLAAMLIGVVLSVASKLFPADVVQVALIGLLSGLAASGFYDIGNMIGVKAAK
ncbi:MAG: hypothetical protein IPO08_20290 [Xanthomonadales bacterium]|nr:hypothetical protein [Xanthomonadales bacterium]